MRHETVLLFQAFFDQDVFFDTRRYDRADQLRGSLHKHDASPIVEIVQVALFRDQFEPIDKPITGSALV